MPAVLDEIKAGNPEASLTVLIATGFHRPTTRQELIYKFGEDIVDRDDIHFVIHQSHNDEDMVPLGTLPVRRSADDQQGCSRSRSAYIRGLY